MNSPNRACGTISDRTQRHTPDYGRWLA